VAVLTSPLLLPYVVRKKGDEWKLAKAQRKTLRREQLAEVKGAAALGRAEIRARVKMPMPCPKDRQPVQLEHVPATGCSGRLRDHFIYPPDHENGEAMLAPRESHQLPSSRLLSSRNKERDHAYKSHNHAYSVALLSGFGWYSIERCYSFSQAMHCYATICCIVVVIPWTPYRSTFQFIHPPIIIMPQTFPGETSRLACPYLTSSKGLSNPSPSSSPSFQSPWP
jgi:hypothetical protein